jgi:hypothetical protein
VPLLKPPSKTTAAKTEIEQNKRIRLPNTILPDLPVATEGMRESSEEQIETEDHVQDFPGCILFFIDHERAAVIKKNSVRLSGNS